MLKKYLRLQLRIVQTMGMRPHGFFMFCEMQKLYFMLSTISIRHRAALEIKLCYKQKNGKAEL